MSMKDNIKESLSYVEVFLDFYREDDPPELENPQDMLNHILATLEEVDDLLDALQRVDSILKRGDKK